MTFSPLATVVYKGCFGASRFDKTVDQVNGKQEASSTANAARVGVTIASTVGPAKQLLGKTAKSAPALTKFCDKVAKLGLVTNIAYSAAKVADAPAEKKDEALLGSSGNITGMYAFEKLYASQIERNKDIIDKSLAKILDPIGDAAGKSSKNSMKKVAKFFKSGKPKEMLLGIGFVIASFSGCFAGEWLGRKVYATAIADKPNENNQNFFATIS